MAEQVQDSLSSQAQSSQDDQSKRFDKFYHAAPQTFESRGIMNHNRQHNQIACLNKEYTANEQIKQMMEFLERSRIHKAITADPLVYQVQVQEFWSTATIDSVTKPLSIHAIVGNEKFYIQEKTVRRVLEMQDSRDDIVNPSMEKVRGCLYRCGYPELKGTVNKKFFCPPFKYLAHVLIHCLSSKKAGADTLSEPLQNVFASLVMNMPFNISKVIWDALVEAASNKRADFDFLLYPRFIQMMIDAKLPKVPKVGNIIPMARMSETTIGYMTSYQGKRPDDVPLWGALINAGYKCPPLNKWKNDDESYDDDVVILDSPPIKPSRGKRTLQVKRHTEELRFSAPEQAKRRRAALVLRPRDDLPTDSEDPHPIPSSSTGTARPQSDHPSVIAPTTQKVSVDDLMVQVRKLVAKEQAREKEIAELVKKMDAKDKELAEVKKEMKEKEEENKKLIKSVKDLQKCYDDLQETMVFDKEGYARHTEFVVDEDLYVPDTEIEKAGTSGTPPA